MSSCKVKLQWQNKDYYDWTWGHSACKHSVTRKMLPSEHNNKASVESMEMKCQPIHILETELKKLDKSEKYFAIALANRNKGTTTIFWLFL